MQQKRHEVRSRGSSSGLSIFYQANCTPAGAPSNAGGKFNSPKIAGTHTLKIRCVCTDENSVSEGRNLLKTQDIVASYRECAISTTTLFSMCTRNNNKESENTSRSFCFTSARVRQTMSLMGERIGLKPLQAQEAYRYPNEWLLGT